MKSLRSPKAPESAALKILTLLTLAPTSLGPEDLARESGLQPDAIRRAIRALEAEGFATDEGGSGRLVVGPRFLELAKRARSNHVLEREIRPVMRELAAAAGETVTLNTYAPGATSSICVLVEESPSPLHYAVEVGEVKPLHAGSSGRAILAHLSDEEIEHYISSTGLPAITPRTNTDPKRLWRELHKVRKRGYAISRGQRVEGAVAIAGSVFDADGKIHASLVLTTPSYRFRPAHEAHVAGLVMQTARRISGLIVTRGQP